MNSYLQRYTPLLLLPILIFFSPLKLSADLLGRAENLFGEELFSDAIALYEESLLADDFEDKRSFIQQRLAECHLEQEHPLDALAVLDQMNAPSSYLMAVAYRQQRQHQKAIEILQSSPSSSEVAFELGLNYFSLDDHDKASKAFTSIHDDSSNQDFLSLSQLYLARIALNKGEFKEAKQHLNHPSIARNPELAREKWYWLGVCAFKERDYIAAADYFNLSLPKNNSKNGLRRPSTLRFLAWSKLKLAEKNSGTSRLDTLLEAEDLFQNLMLISHEESLLVEVGEFHLLKGRLLEDDNATDRVKDITSALQEKNPGEAAYLQGLRAMDQGAYLQQTGNLELAKKSFEEATKLFGEAYELFSPIDHPKIALTVKYQSLSHFHLGKKDEAIALLDNLIHLNFDRLKQLENPQEIYYLLALMSDTTELFEKTIKEGIEYNPKGECAALLIKLKAIHYLKTGRKIEAMDIFKEFVEKFPESHQIDEVLFFQAQCTLDKEEKKQLLTNLFQNYPDSAYSPEAYFSCYSYREYVKGHRQSIKHLKEMPAKYPESPLTITAFYLIGLDYKKDRLSDNNKVLQRKNYIASIDSFNQAEAAFESLYGKNLLLDNLDYYTQLRYKATLERGLANLAIAKESQDTKKKIYLDYTRTVFSDLADELNDRENRHTSQLVNDKIRHELLDEAEFWLAKTDISSYELIKANKVLDRLIGRHQSLHVSASYYYSRALYEKALLAAQDYKYQTALDYLLEAEKNARGLSVDEKLDLWIQQSLCYCDLNQLHTAMSILSKVINEDAISGLRVKAMFLRSTVYEKQGRPELAMKQLKATSKKGGEWGLKAKEKLEQHYGYE